MREGGRHGARRAGFGGVLVAGLALSAAAGEAPIHFSARSFTEPSTGLGEVLAAELVEPGRLDLVVDRVQSGEGRTLTIFDVSGPETASIEPLHRVGVDSTCLESIHHHP